MMMLIDTMIDMMSMTIDTIIMRVTHQLILIHSNQLTVFCLATCLM